MINYFSISDFTSDETISVAECDKILTKHLPVLNAAQHLLGVDVRVQEYEAGKMSLKCEKMDELFNILCDSGYTRIQYDRQNRSIKVD